MADWDADGPQLEQNLIAALRAARDAARARHPPLPDLALTWHALVMAGLDLPDPAYRGAFRGSPGLAACEVRIGAHFGTPAAEVTAELAAFSARLTRAVAALDARIPPGEAPGDADLLNAVVELCAWAHAEWVRIHPFANGNGRTARLWTAYLAMRYGLPPFVRLRPRPGDPYGAATAAAMTGDRAPLTRLFHQMLQARLDG